MVHGWEHKDDFILEGKCNVHKVEILLKGRLVEGISVDGGGFCSLGWVARDAG